jgi:hypothetical protein
MDDRMPLNGRENETAGKVYCGVRNIVHPGRLVAANRAANLHVRQFEGTPLRLWPRLFLSTALRVLLRDLWLPLAPSRPGMAVFATHR